MNERQELLEAIKLLEATFRKSASLGDENFKEHRKEAVQLRREIAAQLANISKLGTTVFEGKSTAETFRSQFASMRATMAMHHASWPIIAIDLENPEYRASATTLRESNGKFIAWVRMALQSAR